MPIAGEGVLELVGVVGTSNATIRKYGLTVEEWWSIVRKQGGACAICRRVPQSGRLVIDHEHVRGWKHMRPSDRRKYVRGIVCSLCNGKCVSKWVTLDRARQVVAYMERYESIRPREIPPRKPKRRKTKVR